MRAVHLSGLGHVLVWGVAAAFLALLARAPPAARAQGSPDKYRVAIGTLAPEGSAWASQFTRVKARVEAESGGRLKVILFLGGRRGSEREMLAEVRAGKLQGAALSCGTLAAEVPEVEVLELPFLVRDGVEADHLIDGVLRADLDAAFEARGLFAFVWSENGWRSIGSRAKPVRRPEDLAGLRARAQESEASVSFWKALGASPVEMPAQEVLAELAAGHLDAFDQTPIFLTASGWDREVKFLTLSEHIYQPGVVFYSKAFLDGLPADLRAILLKGGAETSRASRADVRAAAEETVKELGTRLTLVRLTEEEREAFRKRCQPVVDAARAGPLGGLVKKAEAALEKLRKGGPPTK